MQNSTNIWKNPCELNGFGNKTSLEHFEIQLTLSHSLLTFYGSECCQNPIINWLIWYSKFLLTLSYETFFNHSQSIWMMEWKCIRVFTAVYMMGNFRQNFRILCFCKIFILWYFVWKRSSDIHFILIIINAKSFFLFQNFDTSSDTY